MSNPEAAAAVAQSLTPPPELTPGPVTYAVPPVPGARIAAAIAQVQGRLHSVGKDRDVRVTPKEGGASYTFRYATLAAIWEVIRKPCAEAGLAIVQFPTVDLKAQVVTVETRIIHVSGESLTSHCVLPLKRTDAQGIGAIISYARRYGVSSMLGVTQDDENDEQAIEDDRYRAPPPQRTQAPPRTPPTPKPASSAPADEPPISEAEMHLAMDSCSTKQELAKTAAKIAGKFSGDARTRLLDTYKKNMARVAAEGGAQ